MTKLRTTAVVCLVLLLIGCGKQSGEKPEGESNSPVPDVTIAKVKRGQITENLMVTGNLAAQPNRDAKVAALVPGRIARVVVVEGSAVQRGEILAELDTTLLKEQERQAEAAVAQAKASVENARITLEREQKLLTKGVSSRKEVEDAKTQLAVSTATLNQAQAGLASARAQVARASVRSPFTGTVVKRFAGVGEQVDGSAAQPIVEVAQIDSLELLGTVAAGRLPEIRTGETFRFEMPSVPGEQFTAKVVSILPAVDPATNNGTVRIHVDNPKHLLKLGEYLAIDLRLKGNGSHLFVPKQAIYPDESGEPHVYKVSGDEAESAAVRVGVQTKDNAEILSGVHEGDTVIVNGGYGLPEKAKVHVKQ